MGPLSRKARGFGGFRFTLPGLRPIALGAPVPTDPVRRAAGAKAQALGGSLEKWVEGLLDQAVADGLLAEGWVHTGAAFKPVGGGKFIPIAPGVADYVAMYRGPGRMLAMEAKSREDRIYWSDVTDLQRKHLDATADGGGVSVLVAELRPGGRRTRYAVPWADVPWVMLESALSVGTEELSPWAVTDGAFLRMFAACN